jgi:hypothetical protein
MTKYERLSIWISIGALIVSVASPVATYFWLDPTIQQLRHQPRLHVEQKRDDQQVDVSIRNVGRLPAQNVQLVFRPRDNSPSPNPLFSLEPPLLYSVEIRDTIVYATLAQPLGAGNFVRVLYPNKPLDIYIYSGLGQIIYVPYFSFGGGHFKGAGETGGW